MELHKTMKNVRCIYCLRPLNSFGKCPDYKCPTHKHDEPMCKPITPEDLSSHWGELSKMHVGNRLRMMFGMPMLPEPKDSARDALAATNDEKP